MYMSTSHKYPNATDCEKFTTFKADTIEYTL